MIGKKGGKQKKIGLIQRSFTD
jgi:hypothetical protein